MEKRWIPPLLLAVFFLLALGSMTHNSATSDEVAHIPAGYSYWKYFDYKINPEHPPFIKLWATIPLLILQPNLPDEPQYWERGDQWEFGRQFLYWSSNDADNIYFWCRLMIVLISLTLGYYVYRWASELYGWKAGALALGLYVFDPNIIAHSTIVQTDIPIAAGIFILIYYVWKYLKDKKNRIEPYFSIKELIVLGMLAGLCFAIKYTGIYVIGFLMITCFIHIFFSIYLPHQKQQEKEQQTNDSNESEALELFKGFYRYFTSEKGKAEVVYAGKALGIIFIIGILFLLGTYGFVNIKYYLTGFQDVVIHSSIGHPAYLLGMNSQEGWWYYFIVAFLVKTPIPTILILIATFFVFFKTQLKRWDTLENELFLLVPAGLYFLSFVVNDINIGLRHILPIYPFLYVFTGSLIATKPDLLHPFIIKYKKYAVVIGGIFLAWLVIGTALAYPYYIAYFNEFAGGSENGYKYLLDSNLDWGQGLKETAQWLNEHGYKNQTIRMTYFGSEDPLYRGITSKNIACTPTPGIHIISASRLYDFMDNQYSCADWLFNYKPIAVIGYSIFIYDIQDKTVIENYNNCKTDCTKACAEKGKIYGDSIYKDKCICICTEATNEELGIL